MKKRRKKSRKDARFTKKAKPTQVRHSPEQPRSLRLKHPFLSHALIWFGSIASAFTFVGGLQTVTDFSPWATWFLSHWVSLLTTFWIGFFQFFGAEFHRDGVAPATFIFAMLIMGFGSLLLTTPSEDEIRRARNLSFWKHILQPESGVRYAEGLAIGFTIGLAALYIFNPLFFDSQFKDEDLNFEWMKWVLILSTPFLYVSIALQRSRTDFLHFFLLSISMCLLYALMLVPVASNARSQGQKETWSVAFMIINLSIFLIPTKMMTLVALAKPKFWNVRMLYVWLTIALIFALDWIARSAISMQPPRI